MAVFSILFYFIYFSVNSGGRLAAGSHLLAHVCSFCTIAFLAPFLPIIDAHSSCANLKGSSFVAVFTLCLAETCYNNHGHFVIQEKQRTIAA